MLAQNEPAGRRWGEKEEGEEQWGRGRNHKQYLIWCLCYLQTSSGTRTQLEGSAFFGFVASFGWGETDTGGRVKRSEGGSV